VGLYFFILGLVGFVIAGVGFLMLLHDRKTAQERDSFIYGFVIGLTFIGCLTIMFLSLVMSSLEVKSETRTPLKVEDKIVTWGDKYKLLPGITDYLMYTKDSNITEIWDEFQMKMFTRPNSCLVCSRDIWVGAELLVEFPDGSIAVYTARGYHPLGGTILLLGDNQPEGFRNCKVWLIK